MSPVFPRSSSTGIKVGLTALAAAALVATAASAATAAPTPRLAAASAPAGVTAAITVVLSNSTIKGTPEISYHTLNVPVSDAVELDLAATTTYAFDNPNEFCGREGVNVDIDPTTLNVTATAVEGICEFTDMELTVVLTGASFGTLTVAQDDVWSEITFSPDGPPAFEGPRALDAGLDATGSFRMGRSVVTALVAPQPVLTSATVSETEAGSTLHAVWSGAQPALVDGTQARFTFATAPAEDPAPAEVPAPAAPATAVAGTPVFTG